MGAPVSGLISRSVWAEEGLHGCVVCDHLQSFECSQMLVDTVAHFREQLDGKPSRFWLGRRANAARWQLSRKVIRALLNVMRWTALTGLSRVSLKRHGRFCAVYLIMFLFGRWMTRMSLFWLGWQKRKVSGDGSRGYARSVSCGYHYQKGTLMKKQPNPWELGATLYMPATRKDIAEVVLEGKYRGYALWLSAWKMRSASMTSLLRFRISHCF
jgi:hypothetical protein